MLKAGVTSSIEGVFIDIRVRGSSVLPILLVHVTPRRFAQHPPLLVLTHLGRAAVQLSTPDDEGQRGPGRALGARVGSEPSSLVLSQWRVLEPELVIPCY